MCFRKGRSGQGGEGSRREKNTAAAGPGAASPAEKKRKLDGFELMEYGPGVAQQVDRVATPDAFTTTAEQNKEWKAPLLFTTAAIAAITQNLTGCVDILAHLDKAKVELIEEERKNKAAIRGTVEVPQACMVRVKEAMSDLYPLDRFTENGETTLHKTLEPQLTAMTTNTVFAQAEKSHMACIRWSYVGTKAVLMTPESAIMTFMTSRNPGTMPSFAAAWAYFKSMSQQLLAAYSENHGKDLVFACTVSAGEALYIPAAYIVAERGQAENCVGVRMSVLSNYHGAELQKVLLELEARQKDKSPSGEVLVAALKVAKPIQLSRGEM